MKDNLMMHIKKINEYCENRKSCVGCIVYNECDAWFVVAPKQWDIEGGVKQ